MRLEQNGTKKLTVQSGFIPCKDTGHMLLRCPAGFLLKLGVPMVGQDFPSMLLGLRRGMFIYVHQNRMTPCIQKRCKWDTLCRVALYPPMSKQEVWVLAKEVKSFEHRKLTKLAGGRFSAVSLSPRGSSRRLRGFFLGQPLETLSRVGFRLF